MEKANLSLTKICSNCGQRKPLSAFLQLVGSSSYGNICSSCRKTAPEAPKEKEESTRSTTGAKIDAKLKVKETADKREAFKQVEEEYFDEREKTEEKQIKREEKIGRIFQDEKKHRSFLEKRSFLGEQKNKPASSEPAFGSQEQIAEAGRIDLTTSTADLTRVAGTVKLTSPFFNTVMAWLGDTPLKRALEGEAAQNRKKGKAAPAAPAAPTDPVTDYVHRNSGPKSGR